MQNTTNPAGKLLPLLILGVMLFAAAPTHAQEEVSMDFRGVELQVVLDAVSDLTGKRFLYIGGQGGGGGQSGAPVGKQEVWFRCPRDIPVTRVYEVFEAIMELHGYALIETGSPDARIVKVVPKEKANVKAVEYVTAEELEVLRYEDRFVTFAYNFDHISDGLRVQQQLRTIAPGSQDGLMILGVQNLPFIIMSGFSPTVYRLSRILEQMDVPPEAEELVVVPVLYALASDIKGLIDPLLQRRPGQAGGAAGTYVEEQQPILQADDRTNSLIIQGTSNGISRILTILEKLDTQVEETTRFHVVQLKHSVAEELATTLNEVIQGLQSGSSSRPRSQGAAPPAASGLVGEINITHDEPTNSLIVLALERDFQEVKDLIEKLDRRKRQVFIEAAFVEVSSTSNLSHAIELAAIDLANDLGLRVAGATFFSGESGPFSALVDDMGNPITGGGVPAGRFPIPPSNGALITLFNQDIFSIPLMLRALATQSDVTVLATPKVLANDNEQARISIRDEEPTSSINTTETGVTTQTFAGTEDAVTELTITPHIGSDDELNLEILQIIEEFGERPIAGLPPAKLSREIETRVTVPNGRTIILGGLRARGRTETVSKVPIVGDIPLLGTLFQFRETTDEANDIYIFLTPRILKDDNFDDLLELSQERKEDLEENSGLETIEFIDDNYRRGLHRPGAVGPRYYIDPARPGDVMAPHSGSMSMPSGSRSVGGGNFPPLIDLTAPPAGVAPAESMPGGMSSDPTTSPTYQPPPK